MSPLTFTGIELQVCLFCFYSFFSKNKTKQKQKKKSKNKTKQKKQNRISGCQIWLDENLT